MKTLEQIESDVRKLSPQEQEQLRDWLENLLEDRLELKDEFKAEIEAGKKDIAEGRYRIQKP
jgi:mRNA-degrading endonuclease RelE of RelBE toxin-antitoxin system